MRSTWFIEGNKERNRSEKNREQSNNISSTTTAPDRLPIIVLASASKNRLKLLKKIGINPIVEPSDFPENLSKCQPPEKFVVDTAWHKAHDVAKRFAESGTCFDVVIGCDSVIFFDGLILGKPKDLDEAFDTLKRLNGQKHTVYTGVAIINQQLEVQKFYDETVVEFGNIPEKVLKAYVDSGDPMGHAGSYAIQGKAGAFVKSISGSYHNVVGLPIYEVVKRMSFFIQK